MRFRTILNLTLILMILLSSLILSAQDIHSDSRYATR